MLPAILPHNRDTLQDLDAVVSTDHFHRLLRMQRDLASTYHHMYVQLPSFPSLQDLCTLAKIRT